MKNEDDFVRAAVLVVFEFAVGLFRPRAVSGHVLVEEHRDAAGVEIAPARNLRGLDVVMAQRTVRDFFGDQYFISSTLRTRVGGRR